MDTSPFLIEALEGSTPQYSGILTDENDAPVGSGALLAGKMTLYSVSSGAIINGRNGQNILNANNVTISVAGAIVWKIMEADTKIIDTNPGVIVTHRAVLVFDWLDATSTARQMGREISLRIVKVKKAPFA